ncbi:MAG TPA: TonB-dependent receptor [Povalibacter sp.]|uniref:TonB-dependent receptor n=1 Tax=Povalibacter sp. TaxID=1962978 RepID=UPI002BC62603|nr:TonB-dependent receptor [Povalibacter sp.]HMN45135.1 TonB-dependent receptor [Povalibacter sp.]
MRASVLCLLGSAILADMVSAAEQDVLEEVIVTSTLRRQSLIEAPVSVTVLDAVTLRDAGQQHFEDVLASVPNLHWAGGTSRPRYFQLRGIGEREQYEGAPNPSVGFLIDDIDFSGIGMAATLFDVDRVEVLRGPQGMRYGANALAGLIVMRSADPRDEFDFSTAASVGDYGTSSIGAVATGPVESLDSSWRVGVQRYRSDGFRDDTYLNRDDTNDRDELTARAKWRWRPSESTTVDLAWLHADLDNGYDAWSIDNSRTSLADRPGKDAQKADGGSLRIETAAGSLGSLTVIAALSDSKGEYSFDGDWGNADAWAPYTYDYFYEANSERRARSLEVRLASPDSKQGLAWLVGAYTLDTEERIDEVSVGEYIDPFYPEYSGSADDSLRTHYDATNIALFGQLDGALNERWGWSLGLRGEQRDAKYRDNGIQDGEPRVTDTSEKDEMWGGQATLHFDASDNARLFATVSRGYKAGGFNLGRAAALKERFEPEYLWSFDVGAKGEWFERRLYADITAFYMRREDMQVSTGIQLDPIGDPNSYLFITDNASGGRNLGVEMSARWRATSQLEFGGSLGLLHTRYSGYRPEGIDLSDRDQAHAPEYSLSLNATWRSPLGWMARADFSAIDDFYFDVPPNDQRAAAYSLVNLKAGYEAERWSVHLWARNVFDEDYAVRGFYFGNEPPDFGDKRYIQLGEPRQVGVNVLWSLR